MTALDDLAAVVALACLIEDRDPKEQKALARVAARVDREWNRQTTTNRRLPRAGPNGYRIDVDGVHHGEPCSFSDDHPKSCPCRGTGVAWEPAGGWSRLAARVVETWAPDETSRA